MNKLVASIVILLATSTPALASATITCRSEEGVSVRMLAFFGAELMIHAVEIITAEKHWSTHNVDAEQMEMAQSFSDGESFKIDLAPPNFQPLEPNQDLIAKIRLFGADEGRDVALAGTLHMPNSGVYALICEGP